MFVIIVDYDSTAIFLPLHRLMRIHFRMIFIRRLSLLIRTPVEDWKVVTEMQERYSTLAACQSKLDVLDNSMQKLDLERMGTYSKSSQ
jgi:hypothetical protein